jgi:hypothetical protein
VSLPVSRARFVRIQVVRRDSVATIRVKSQPTMPKVTTSRTMSGPPLVDTFLSAPRWTTGPVVTPSSSRSKKAIQRPAGEKNGARALAMPASGEVSS